MLRAVAASCRTSSRYGVLSKLTDNLLVNGGIRSSSNLVNDANAKAKAEAKRQLDAVTSVIGKLDGWDDPPFDEKFIKRHVDFFNRKEIDQWELRRGIHELADYDTVPDPEIIKAVLHACRRLNDLALAVRVLEFTKVKCGQKVKQFWPYIEQEIMPTVRELGISTPEELGYDKPELAVIDVDDIH